MDPEKILQTFLFYILSFDKRHLSLIMPYTYSQPLGMLDGEKLTNQTGHKNISMYQEKK